LRHVNTTGTKQQISFQPRDPCEGCADTMQGVRHIVPNLAVDRIDARRPSMATRSGCRSSWSLAGSSPLRMAQQISAATEGGSGTPVPDLSIEVDDLSHVHRRMQAAGFNIEYGPVTEPWGVRRRLRSRPVRALGQCVGIPLTLKAAQYR
jgi:hypothetical protein